nr:zinc finger, CCHC-type [Tanacetum cinerariifolium]
MVDAAIKRMASNFVKLDKFKGVGFRRWHKKMHFLLFSMSVVYVLTNPILEDGGDDATVEQIRKRAKWDNRDYVRRGLVLNDFKHTLKHLKEELTLVELGSHLRIKESLRKCGRTGHSKRDCKGVNVSNKANGSGIKGSVDGSSNSLKGQNMFNKPLQVYYVTYVSEAYFVQDDDVTWWIDSGAMVYVCKDRCWLSLNDGSILHMENESTALVHGRVCIDFRDANFNKNRFSSVPRPSQRSLKDGTEDIGGSVVPEEVSDQHSFCFPKTFVEAMKSRDLAFWKKEINDEIDSIMGNNTWVLTDLPPGCKPLGCKWIIKRKLKYHKTANFYGIYSQSDYSSDGCKDSFLNGELDEEGVSQLEYFRVIGCLIYDITYTMPDIAFVVGKLSKYTSNCGTQHWQAIQRVLKYFKKIMDYRLIYSGYPLVLEGYTDASRISNTEDNSFTNDWVFLLSDGVLLGLLRNKPASLICFEPAEKEDEVVNFSMVNFFKKVLSKSMNKEELPMYCTKLGRIVGNLVQLYGSVHTGLWDWRRWVFGWGGDVVAGDNGYEHG